MARFCMRSIPMQSWSVAPMVRSGNSTQAKQLLRCLASFNQFEVSPIELLPDIPQGLRYPEFGRGREALWALAKLVACDACDACAPGKNYRWAQNPQALQIRVKVAALRIVFAACWTLKQSLGPLKVPPETKSKDVDFDIGRTWLQIWAPTSECNMKWLAVCDPLLAGAGNFLS